MSRSSRWRTAAAAAMALSAAFATGIARAVVVGDGTPASCTEAALDAALEAGGQVSFACGGPATIVVTARKRLAGDLAIDGGGTITLSGGGAVSVLLVAAGAHVRLDDLTVADGVSDIQPGAAIRNLGSLEMYGVTLADSFTRSFGGGLSNEGFATVDGSTIAFNQGGSGGGGIANFRTLVLRNSTVFRNTSGIEYAYGSEQPGSGGGILNFGVLNAVNSTLTANVAISNNAAFTPVNAYGGGLYNVGTASLTNCTLTRNRTPEKGYCPALNNAGLLTARNVLLGDHRSGCCNQGVVADESVANLADDEYNECPTFLQVPYGALGLLGLAAHGGPTMTVGLRADSVAIDAGDAGVCADAVAGRDQRGVDRFRPGDDACDVGAFEARGAADPPPTPVPNGTFFAFRGEAGDVISGGRSVYLTPSDGRFNIDAEPGFASVQVWTREPVTVWQLWLSSPAMTELAVGDYEGSQRWPFQAPDQPGLSVSGDGRGCNMSGGRFSVRENVTAIDGTLVHFAADFEQHCEFAAPALYGSVRIDSAVPTASPPRGSPTRTGTPTAGPATPTPRVRAPCIGDCDGDGRVTIAEIILAIRAALGQASVDECAAVDADLDGAVSINDLIRAIDGVLINCG